MGRRDLALLTATEKPEAIAALKDVLQEMADSNDPVVSDVIREYLLKRESHAG